MPKKQTRKTSKPVRPQLGEGVQILNAGSVLEDPITRTLETNYMPYAMSVIVSRALPEIDGFKPAHRKLLYTMYGMGLLKGARTKSANIVGATMHLNPHGDAAIYDTMVRMGRGNESLLVPYVDSKGNFGKAYSRDMSCAAARYTEARLEPVCEELFRDIDKETVDFVPNYDGTTTEPTLLPVTFPTILANNTLGIAVGMACNICSFNLAELCATTVALLKDHGDGRFPFFHAQAGGQVDAHLAHLAILKLGQAGLVDLVPVGEEEGLQVVAGLGLDQNLVPFLQLVGAGGAQALGGDLVAEGFAHLADAEGQLAAGGALDVGKVDKDALGGLGPQVAHRGAVLGDADGGLEHQVVLGQLGGVGGLAVALQAAEHQDGLALVLDIQAGGFLAAHQGGQLLVDDLDHLLGGGQAFHDLLAHGPLGHLVAEVFGHFIVDVGFQQGRSSS